MTPRDNRLPLCPACGALMYPARLLKGYPKTGEDAERRTCALHGPLGQFRHIAIDRREDGSTAYNARASWQDSPQGGVEIGYDKP